MRRVPRSLLVVVAVVALLAIGYLAGARHEGGGRVGIGPAGSSASAVPSSRVGSGGIALSRLPAEARHTVDLIKAGGPFPYSRDGIVFRNAEGRLPKQHSGYYHEYTVPTPGESDRGARRIITGSDDEFFYTADHYETFQKVDVNA